MNTYAIETTTWFDQRPSHKPADSRLWDLRQKVDAAWAEHDALVEQRYYANQDGMEEVSHEMIRAAADYAVQLEMEYEDLWKEINR